MKKNVSVFFYLLSQFFFATGQTAVYQKTFGDIRNEAAYGIVSTNDGGYAMTGSTNSYGAGDFDVLLIKLDSNADLQWSHVYGGTGNDQALQLTQTYDGGFAICGRTTSYGAGNFDALLIKTDNNGILEWMKTYGGANEERVLNIRQTSDHGFLLAGSTLSYGQGNWDMMFIKTDSVGDTLWTKIMGGINADQGTDADQTSDGGFVFTGRVSSWGSGSNDVFLAKTTTVGDTVWTRVFGSSGWDEGMKVKQTADHGYVVAGSSTGFTNGGYDVYLNKTDSAGHLSWSKLYAGVNTDAMYDILQLDDGGYIMTGQTESFGINHHPRLSNPHSLPESFEKRVSPIHTLGTEHSNVFVIRTDTNGDTLWTRTFGGGRQDESNSIIQTPAKEFMIAAYSGSFSNDSIKFFLIKMDSTGFTGCNSTSASPSVTTPATVEMNTTAHVTSGMMMTEVLSAISSSPTVIQNTICVATSGIYSQQSLPETVFAFPNPSASDVTIAVPALMQNFSEAEIFVFDVYGSLIKTYTARTTGKILLPVSSYAAGIYLVKVQLTNGSDAMEATFESRFVVQRP